MDGYGEIVAGLRPVAICAAVEATRRGTGQHRGVDGDRFGGGDGRADDNVDDARA